MDVKAVCPGCNQERVVKNWNTKKWGGPPYKKLCKRCCQLNQSEETKKKKSEALKGIKKPEEYSIRLKKRHEEDHSLRENLKKGCEIAWNKGKKTGPRDQETKDKISESMKKHFRKDKE